MTTKLQTVSTDTLMIDALALLREYNISCLPVVKEERLVGLVTERDVVRLTEEMLLQMTDHPKKQLV